ncbi:tyrosine-type recombinase/integrase [Streptomyces spirodelae]|uniref:Tyrosine-type recombinase/integrase n=1 Tax=Streptomyces spirodelae TaxID=2812904 RepID=A0ABS3WMV0_9ACTN|nr:tyrosine-type recombinase/integrase [Streptomyces spirodelae]MBO8184221.1 tyrosine-type recombinase/integrase [Streptomyces spirodelae]
MGTFFKTCDCTRQNRCPHPYTIRFRDAAGRQREETGLSTQEAALDRLTKLYEEKRSTPRHQADLKRELGKQRFGDYASSWLTRQRHYAESSTRTVNGLLDRQVLPVVGSRRMETFISAVVEDFIMAMEEEKVGLATQQNAFDTLKKILLDAKRKGAIPCNPVEGVIPPEYIPRRVTIPTLEEVLALKDAASEALVVLIDLMSGCGHRNGEAYAANVHRLVADDVYRITEQIDGVKRRPARLKHRKPSEFRETPMPAMVRDSIFRYEARHGTDANGYLLRTERRPYWAHTTLEYQWEAAKRRAGIERKLTPYSLRHYFASNCLSNGIPITDVAEWMGHKNIAMTFRIYRHLMPASIGRAAKILDAGLHLAA